MGEQNEFIPDYSKYTLSELEDIYSRMQKDNFLERVDAIESEIKKRKAELGKDPSIENLEKSQYNYEYAGFWKRVIAVILDVIIAFLFLPITNYLYVYSFSHKTIVPMVLFNIASYSFLQLYMLTKFGGTPGHLIMQLRTINNYGNYLDVTHAFLRSLIYLPASILILLQLNHAVYAMPAGITISNMWDATTAIRTYGGVYDALRTLISLVVYFDIGAVLLNKKKRAIHDYIAGSYVVTKNSIEKIEIVKSNLIYT